MHLPLALEGVLVAAVVPELEGQAIPVQRGFTLAEGFLHLVAASKSEIYEVAVGVADQRPALDPDTVLSLYPAVLVLPKGDAWGSGQV